MKKHLFIYFICLFLAGLSAVSLQAQVKGFDSGQYEKRRGLINSIESWEIDWKDFVDAIQSRQITFHEVSPSAIADYMEAFANEGLLWLIPADYFKNEQIKTSLEVVFEDPDNAVINRYVHKNSFFHNSIYYISER